MCAKIMVLQQLWLLLAGVHGIVRQHCIACVLASAEGTQSANGRNRKTPIASTENSRLPLIPFRLYSSLDAQVKQSIPNKAGLCARHAVPIETMASTLIQICVMIWRRITERETSVKGVAGSVLISPQTILTVRSGSDNRRTGEDSGRTLLDCPHSSFSTRLASVRATEYRRNCSHSILSAIVLV